ncbi:MAG: DUF3987 domain-containing protein, partial [Rhodanobacter sp.]
MNAVIQETEQQATRRLFHRLLADGYRVTDGYLYRTADGEPWCRRIRFDHPSKKKEYRPLHWSGTEYVASEPPTPTAGKPLYCLPELLDADPTALVWIVEGEKCADALASLGLIVTTSGSMSSARDSDMQPLAGHPCLIWPDHDKAGADYADDVTAKLRAMGCTVEIIDVHALGLSNKGDAVDWLAMYPEATAVDVLALARLVAREIPDASARLMFASAPEPLRRPLLPSIAYPLDALGSLLGDAAKRIHAVVQAPAGLCGQSILAAASLAVQSHADVSISGSVEPLSLWHVSIGASGERKSAADHWALLAHNEYERAEAEAWRLAMVAHEMEMSAWKAAERGASQSGKGKNMETIRAALRDVGAPPDVPLLPWLLLSEPTMEGLHKAFQFGRPGIGLSNDDAGDFLGGHAMN